MHFGARTRPVEVLDLSKSGPEVVSFTLKNPMTGRNRQGVFADFTAKDFSAEAARLDLAGMFWERLPDFPRPRQSMQTLVQERQALAIGGFGFDEPPGPEARANRYFPALRSIIVGGEYPGSLASRLCHSSLPVSLSKA